MRVGVGVWGGGGSGEGEGGREGAVVRVVVVCVGETGRRGGERGGGLCVWWLGGWVGVWVC